MLSTRDLRFPPRKRIRRLNYDYSQGGAYFFTICVHRRLRKKDVFASINQDSYRLNRFGKIVENWLDIPNHRSNVELDAFKVMPNHVHCVLFLHASEQLTDGEAAFGPQLKGSLAAVAGGFKSAVSKAIGIERGALTSVWQSRFHDRVIRDEVELTNVRRYIENNPANWANDRCNPDHPGFESVWLGKDPDAD